MNNFKPAFLIVFSIFCSATLFSQKYTDYVFSDSVNYEISDDLKAKGEVILDKDYSIEYVVDDIGERCYTFFRTVRLVNSDDAIESNNKIYLASGSNTEYIFQKARVIKPDGTILDMKEEDILEGVYEDDGNERKYFYYAVEGLEKGSIIEEMSYRVSGAEYYGERYFLQGFEFRLHQTFELICPSHLEFAFQSDNGAGEVQIDTVVTDVNRWYLECDSVVEIRNQSYLFDNVVREQILYKLDRNLARNKADITNYANVVPYFYSRINPEFSKKQIKEIDKIAKELDLENKTELEQILAIEGYYKTNFNVIDNNSRSYEDMEYVFANQAANTWGIGALMAKNFNDLGIKFEIVVTTDRTKIRFDQDFEGYLFLQEVMLYLPKEDIYIAPGRRFTRGKYVPAQWTSNYGLFIRALKVGSTVTPVGEVKFIEPLSYSDNSDIMEIDVDFTENISQPKITFLKSQTGYSAQYTQPYLYLLDEESRTNMENSMPEMVNEDIESDDVTLTNVEADDFGTKPFEIRFSTDDHRFVEMAGEDVLFKVGELIGPQMELYEEEERQFPIEKVSKQYYLRTITLTLPDGYEIKNMEDLSFERKHEENGETTMFFDSQYTQDGNTYTIVSTEYYDQLVYPVSDYDAFAEVVNAAADFNKITLVLKKKSL